MKHIRAFENTKKYTVDDIMYSIEIDDMYKLKTILSSGVDPNSYLKYKYTPIHLAAHLINIDALDMLLEYGADIDAINTYTNETALMSMAHEYSPIRQDLIEIMCYLIEHDADLNPINDSKRDFIEILYRNSNESVVDNIMNRYPDKFKEYIIKRDAKKYNL